MLGHDHIKSYSKCLFSLKILFYTAGHRGDKISLYSNGDHGTAHLSILVDPTKIVNFITPKAVVVVLGCGYTGNI